MSAAEPNAPIPRIALRVAALSLQSAVAGGLVVLGVVGSIPGLRAMVLPLTLYGEQFQAQAVVTGLCLAWLLCSAACFMATWRLQRRSWGRIALGLGAVSAVLAYLSHDDPSFRRPLSMEDISPVFPGAEESYGVLMRYGKDHPLAKAFRAPSFKEPYPNLSPDDPARWRETVTSRRDEFEAHWQALGAERAWWDELAAFDRIGDLTPARIDAEIISFQVLRALSQHAIAVASLQALDGHGDEAVDTLLPTLRIGRMLQPNSRTLVRLMVGVVIEKIALRTAGFILDNAQVSPAARARLAAALGGGDPEAGARQIFRSEYAVSFGAMSSMPAGDVVTSLGTAEKHPWIPRALNALSPLIYNPRATYNRKGELFADWEEYAAHRHVDQMDARWKVYYDKCSGPGLKNVFGNALVVETIPAFTKVSENYWLTEGLRTALVARLTKS
jgi:hypothetical protein